MLLLITHPREVVVIANGEAHVRPRSFSPAGRDQFGITRAWAKVRHAQMSAYFTDRAHAWACGEQDRYGELVDAMHDLTETSRALQPATP